eukprot:Gregarina_sp_Pseudo_9__5575@NODE_74_length_4574_cov_25_621830_g68_i0_p4_GENE_NODE_74_length_4574_cov_25_621830_g68_i0NODE_74_length_4574_cov_25_621830_g68_i0_p4_ORF_typecomplete_len203_score24_66Methyltransf_31/PF13847_6/2_9e19Methyltransf_11/PF08241_12/4_1e18Methyltransf_25/PF13649_6/5e13Methyltransf_23/PF13489_6/7_8e13Ubie_methyltran/PF01209_18/7_2e13TPMT/PF05724_11/4_1e09Methyltransf_12/PF08242_12/7_6e08MetW/PF07021_12/1_2e06NodS/PF05401_11/8_8e07CMAS/PF02353_20/9_9e06TehB/PF03848_14/4_6e05Me
MTQYSKKEFWDERYTKDPEAFEWYADYGLLKSLINDICSKKSKILHVGCGTSNLAEDMEADGYKDITCLDFSSVAVQLKQHKSKKVQYILGDIRNMPEFSTGTFNQVLDKGTLDSLMCGESAAPDVHQMLSEIHRVLRPGGSFLCISHAKPITRLAFFEQPDFQWQVSIRTLQRQIPSEILTQGASNNSVIHVYICERNAAS